MCSAHRTQGAGLDGGVCPHHTAAAQREEPRGPADGGVSCHGDVPGQPRLFAPLQKSEHDLFIEHRPEYYPYLEYIFYIEYFMYIDHHPYVEY